ncbi:MAG: SPFH domain-containing protein [bacterium]|nr:SPFH domain-containing protein [bacterium]
MFGMSKGKVAFFGSMLLLIIIFFSCTIGINDAGQRTVVQYPNGSLFVKFAPGWYLKFFGKTDPYNDVLTLDFGKQKPGEEVTFAQHGVTVRYQDGGNGTIYGKARFNLPNDEASMIKLHKALRSAVGVSEKLIKPVVEEGMNLTAGLMSSEEAYAEKRAIFTQWAQQQIGKGKFQTELKITTDVEEGTGKRVTKNIPVIKYGENGFPIQLESDLEEYSITISGFQITDWDFEEKTLEQISRKRQATMAIITAKADAERAIQEAITAEQEGKRNVMTAKYAKEVEKERAIVTAQQQKEVAVIAAKQKVDVAEQEKLEAEQKKFTAEQYKQEQILRGEGEGEYKRLVMEADGALAQKLETFKFVMAKFAEEFGKQKWVPDIQMNTGAGTTGGNEVSNFMNLFMVQMLKNLQLDMGIPSGRQTN